MISEPARLRDFAARYTAAWCSQTAPSVAACYAQHGSLTGTGTAHRRCFAFWKDADPDVPILRQAKAEYAKLQ